MSIENPNQNQEKKAELKVGDFVLLNGLKEDGAGGPPAYFEVTSIYKEEDGSTWVRAKFVEHFHFNHPPESPRFDTESTPGHYYWNAGFKSVSISGELKGPIEKFMTGKRARRNYEYRPPRLRKPGSTVYD